MKVAMIAEHVDDDQIDGGLQAVTSYLIKTLKAIPEVELHVLTFSRRPDLLGSRTADGYTVHYLPSGRFGTLTAFSRDQATVDNCLRTIGPDIVHSQGAGHYGILAMRCDYPSVVTVHGILRREARYLPGLRRRWRARIHAWLGEAYCIRRGMDTILISPYVAEQYGSRLVGNKHMIANPVDSLFFDVERASAPGRILFAGRLYSLKGVHDLIAAVGSLTERTDVSLVLAGAESDTEYVRRLKSDAARVGLSDRIEFRGILRTDELLQELSRCACLVLPSYQETAPMVVQEAMAAGVPIIATRVGGIPFQIEDGKTGLLFEPGDIGALSRLLSRLLNDRTLQDALGSAARKKAQKDFTAESVARQTVDVYREIISARVADSENGKINLGLRS